MKARLNYGRRGSGAPLLLVHGTGSYLGAWMPVMDRLAKERDVIAIDLPGHGHSPELPAGTPPDAPAFARAISTWLREELGIESAHVAGNSMGGWTALELAKLGVARSVTGIAPAGMWRDRAPRYCTGSLRASIALTRLVGERGIRAATVTGTGRTLLMSQYYARPWSMRAAAAAEALRNVARSPGLEAHLDAITHQRFVGGRDLRVPVTIAWCARDFFILPWQAWRMDELPRHTRRLVLPGCGHAPMSDDPDLVARVILEGSR